MPSDERGLTAVSVVFCIRNRWGMYVRKTGERKDFVDKLLQATTFASVAQARQNVPDALGPFYLLEVQLESLAVRTIATIRRKSDPWPQGPLPKSGEARGNL